MIRDWINLRKNKSEDNATVNKCETWKKRLKDYKRFPSRGKHSHDPNWIIATYHWSKSGNHRLVLSESYHQNRGMKTGIQVHFRHKVVRCCDCWSWSWTKLLIEVLIDEAQVKLSIIKNICVTHQYWSHYLIKHPVPVLLMTQFLHQTNK